MTEIDLYETYYDPRCNYCHGTGFYQTELLKGIVQENDCECSKDYENPEMTLEQLEKYKKIHGLE